MSANTVPTFPITQNVSSVKLNQANYSKDGATAIGPVGTTPTFKQAFVAGENGSRIDQIKVRSLGLNAASVLRLFINDGTTNSLVHEASLSATGAAPTAITITAQTTGSNTFTSSTAMTPGQIVFVTAPGTLTALAANTMYYVSSAPSATTFTLMTENGTAVTVSTSVSSASATANAYPTLEQAALADIDVTITKGSEVVSPIPYLKAGQKIMASIGNVGAPPLNAGWQLTIHGADY